MAVVFDLLSHENSCSEGCCPHAHLPLEEHPTLAVLCGNEQAEEGNTCCKQGWQGWSWSKLPSLQAMNSVACSKVKVKVMAQLLGSSCSSCPKAYAGSS